MTKKWTNQLKVYGVSALALGALVAAGNTATVDAAEVTYTVKPGDTLFEIAASFFGDGARFTDIAHVNDLDNPDLIFVGQTLSFDDEMAPIDASSAEANVVTQSSSKPVETKVETKTATPKTETQAQAPKAQESAKPAINYGEVPEYVLKVVESEAGPSYQDKANVFSVIVNRVESGRWGGTDYMSVVKAPGQFQVTWNGMADRAVVSDLTRQVVADVLANGVTTNAESFRASGDGVTNRFF